MGVSARLYVRLSVCPLAYLKNHTSKRHEIFCMYQLWLWLDLLLTIMQHVMYFRFVNDVTFAHNRSGKGDANRAHAQSDSPGGSTGAKFDVYDRPVGLIILQHV